MFLIRVSRSQWKEQRSSSRFKMATVADVSPKEHICSQCGTTFVQKQSLLRHIRTQHGGVWRCARCSSTFNREDNVKYHERNCDFRATGKRSNTNQIGGGQPKRKRMDNVESDFNALDHTTDHFIKDLKQFVQTPETIINVLKDNIKKLESIIEVELERKRSLKIIIALHATFHQATDPTFLSEPPPVFKTTPIEVLTATDIDEVLQSVIEQLLKKIDDFEERGSGWVLHELSRLDLHTYTYDPLRASTCIPLPDDLKAKHAVVNTQNKV